MSQNKHEWAKQWQAGQMAKMLVEEAIETSLGDMMDRLDHIETDYYDNSIELYFDPGTPADFTLNQAQRDEIASMGFAHGWCNFTDGTECHFSKNYPGERRVVAHPHWTLQRYERRNAR